MVVASPNMSSAFHAETTPLLPEKAAQVNDLESHYQPPIRRRGAWRSLSRNTIAYVVVELLAIGLALKLFFGYRPFSTRLIGPRDPGDDSDSFNCAVEWSDVDKGRGQSSRPSSTAEAEFLEAFSWPGEEISAFTSFDLPTSSPLLYFLSSGHLIAGSVTYDTTARDTDQIKVDIEMRYRTPEGRDLTDVCILKKKDGSSGVGIYGHGDVRDGPSHDLFVKFYVTVKFPGTPSKPLKLQNLDTVMSIFGQKFGNLEGIVSFDKVSVETSNSPITVGSLFAKNVYLSDTNAPIIGHFNVTENLKLSTANAMIDVNAVLSNPDKDSKTTLSMSTSNAVIHSTIQPHSATGKTGGQFVVDASTANAPVDINIPVAPSQSRLSVTASTSMSRVDLKLPIEYEGSITASTSWASTFLEIDTDSADPTGEGLTRKVEVSKSTGSTIKAKTWWGEDKSRTDLGKVDVSTSFGKISIEG